MHQMSLSSCSVALWDCSNIKCITNKMYYSFIIMIINIIIIYGGIEPGFQVSRSSALASLL